MTEKEAQFPKDDADYKKLEKLVARIQQDLAPRSQVTHNVRLKGKSGAQRQIDVLVEDKIGQYNVRIVLDCKDYKHPVDIKDVEECAGLFEDVSAMRGVIVCPAGFTKNAKTRAQQLQIDLYSPVDTEPHKWQARLKVPAVCDFREARMSFGVATSAPLPFKLPNDFMTTTMITDADSGEELGTMLAIASAEWDAGNYPTEPGEHARIPILARKLKMENGYGTQIPVDLTVGLLVSKILYFGQFPVTRLSGFHDRIGDGIITNAFEIGLLSLEEVHKWKRLDDISEASVKPVIILSGLYSWSDEVSPSKA
ncbi:restriction endonuclease [Bradyrhizobium sp. AUGA SZCCT0222]|uniref:restriction endonuclease n=1 Tax=Bradyrhizobium sp. AUGA SZCCT0222 TaxID=2807668 RepID=UPI001BAC83F2|nr:restriction endonuclease [Bradyrhizobium sp. AUGA SZCCT0222]MBR1270323.1 restriction endonuclease [Bradyrhizobium sp. AUGA SZCCT0222]